MTAEEIAAMRAEYAPYDQFDAFDIGRMDYAAGTKTKVHGDSVDAQATAKP